MAKRKKAVQEERLKKQLWRTADTLRKNIDVAEYKHVVLGLIFLKCISDAFVELFTRLESGEGDYAGADSENRDEYRAKNIFFVPLEARWFTLQSKVDQPHLGSLVDAAMYAVEEENASLKDVLPKVFSRQNLDPRSLGSLIELVSTIAPVDADARSVDVLVDVFEYFLGEFALAEGKRGGQFYTPRSVVKMLVAMLEPHKGRVFDPCCGSGGMFVQSQKFVEAHRGRGDDISIYGQESNQTTWRLAKMNTAIHGIDSSQVKWNNEGSFLNDAHKDLKADFIIAKPPFNVRDWESDQLHNDVRWQYGVPPKGNANFAWIQHSIYHLSPGGRAGVMLPRGSLTSRTRREVDIRTALVKDGNLIDCIVNLPARLFLNTRTPAALWFLDRMRNNDYPRKGEILFIDGQNFGRLVGRRTGGVLPEDIQQISHTYHSWRMGKSAYEDVKGFCASVSLEQVAELDYVMMPERYVGLAEEEVDDQIRVVKTIRASQAGLEIVDQERRKKGWKKSDKVWCGLAAISKSTLRRFWERKPIKVDIFTRICQAVEIDDWSSIAEERWTYENSGKNEGGNNHSRVERTIEFPPEHWEAGTSILSYFSRILGVKYPNERIKVRIEQEGLKLRMLIDTPPMYRIGTILSFKAES